MFLSTAFPKKDLKKESFDNCTIILFKTSSDYECTSSLYKQTSKKLLKNPQSLHIKGEHNCTTITKRWLNSVTVKAQTEN